MMLCNEDLMILQDLWNAGFYRKCLYWTDGARKFKSRSEAHAYVQKEGMDSIQQDRHTR